MALGLLERHGGEVPGTLEELAALPGVGQKTANVVLGNAFAVPALPVDTHIFRVARRLGLSAAGSPEKVEADLCRHFPREAWIDLHHQLIIHGRRVCDARKPDCAGCPLLDLCPTGGGAQADPHSGRVLDAPRGAAPAPAPVPAPAPRTGPVRIVSLVPSVTELLAKWGLASRIAGRTAYCVEPRWIRNTVPSMGGTKDPDIPRILSQRPDLVVMERDENTREAAEALAQAGVPLLVLEIRGVRDCLKAFRQLGEAVGLPEAGRERAGALEALLRPAPRKGPRTLVMVWKDPWIAAGPDTYVGDLARQAGFRAVGDPGYPRLDDGALEALDPRVVLLPSEPYRFTARHRDALAKVLPGAQVRLVEGRALTWYLSRTEEALLQLRTLFSELP